jgi:hypothetical protein
VGYCAQIELPAAEPLSVVQAKTFLRLPSGASSQDSDIAAMITSAREDGERISSRVLAQRRFSQVLDSFPYYTDTIQSQQAYPPSYYSLPRYSTTLWNYSQMIKLARTPVIDVESLTYIGTDGQPHTLASGVDFILDPETELARVFPMPGKYWPPVLYTPNAIQIIFKAGYDPDPTKTQTIGLPSPPPNPPNQQASYTVVTGIPQAFLSAIKDLVAFRFQNRGVGDIPPAIERAFMSNGVWDFAPTRG